ncbi:MAG: hypothetical protein EBS06_02155 [Proteobacteria bacterium]|nr:hypothetical protein [Pseudomonadota bacterium]
MKFFLIFTLILFFYLPTVFAEENKAVEGFYVGVDPTKTDNKIGNINKAVSVDSKVAEDRYYGYKFSEAGFFISPEVFLQNGNLNSTSTTNSNNQKSNQIGATPGTTYNVKANIGYEFNNLVSGFVTYDLGSFSYNSGQRSIAVGASNSTSIGVGSQLNLSRSVGVKVIYSQQQFENSAVSGGRIKSDLIKIGTVYNF